jgi:hypothetical protein
MLRAYHFRENKEFKGRHNIQALFLGSGFDRIIPKADKQSIYRAVGEIDARWANDYRYMSAEDLRRRLLELKLNRKVTGDLLEGSSRLLLDAAI